MGWLSDFFLGSEGEIDWDELQKMVKLQSEINKTDRTGIWTGWEWERDSEGNPLNRQVQTINPQFQGAVNRLGNRANTGHTDYTSPGQFSQMLDSKMANQMTQHGIDPASQEKPWLPAAERPGLSEEAYLPPPPPAPGEGEAPPGEQPPPDFVAPPGMAPVKEYDPAEDPNRPNYGLPPDYYNKKGNVRRKYRPDNPNYIGDEFLNRYKEDPDYVFTPDDPRNPDSFFGPKGNLRRKYRIQPGSYNKGG